MNVLVVSPDWPASLDSRRFNSSCTFSNGLELLAARQPTGTYWKDFPVARLRLTMDNFQLDYFRFDGFRIASQRLRSIMDLNPESVQYLDIDASGSSSSVVEADYKILNIPVSESLSDPSRSVYYKYSVFPGGPLLPGAPHSVFFPENTAPDHEMFHDHFFLGHVFCARDLAMRVIKSNCTGVRFFDPSRLGPAEPRRHLTSEGVLREE